MWTYFLMYVLRGYSVVGVEIKELNYENERIGVNFGESALKWD